MPDQSKNLILLTGAGFTRNFGGFLAREMWSKIFNNPSVQSNAKVREVLASDFDFESVYSTILRGDTYDEVDKKIMRDAVEKAYKDLDGAVTQWSFNSSNPAGLNIYGLGEILALVSSKGSDQGCFFTLNQDLYLERNRNFRSPGAAFSLPFLTADNGNVSSVVLPTEEELSPMKSRLNNTSYIKLHGSYGWTSSRGGNQMVIGKNKTSDIGQEPLLKWYLELFENAVYEDNKKLLVIGYGFADAHINDILLKGVREHSLSLYVINPTDPQIFKNRLEGRPEQAGISWEMSEYRHIWDGIKGYFPYTLREIYPPDQSTTTMALEIKRSLES